MKRGDTRLPYPVMIPGDILQQIVDIFTSKGWLNLHIRIRHRKKIYRLSCGERGFLAYRINDHYGLPPGFLGWPVGIITRDDIIHDLEMSTFTSTEPSAQEWLRCIADDDFELNSEVS
jgi:hypothetical protein